jgi:type II secretory pathway pseudopilin PulG
MLVSAHRAREEFMRTRNAITILAVLTVVAAIAGDPKNDDQAKQHETLTALCSISEAIERYSQDGGHYPAAHSLSVLEQQVVPRYARSLPARDGWGNAFEIDSHPTAYTIASCGKGQIGECTSALIGHRGGEVGGEFTDPTYDTILSNGKFIAWPKGLLEAHVDRRGRCMRADGY